MDGARQDEAARATAAGRSRLRIRDAAVEDAALVLRLTLAAYEEYRVTLVPASTVFDETEDQVRRQLMDGGRGTAEPAPSGALVAEFDGDPVGCVRWSVREDAAPGHDSGLGRAADAPAPWLYVGRLSVLPAFRGHGIGTALMAACEDLARRRGIDEVRLGVRLTLVRNEALYERLGYRRTGRTFEREGYGQIAAWMSKRVGRTA